MMAAVASNYSHTGGPVGVIKQLLALGADHSEMTALLAGHDPDRDDEVRALRVAWAEAIPEQRRALREEWIRDALGMELREAAKKGEDEAVVMMREVLNANADPNGVDEDGTTALAWAARNGHERALDVLMDAGADLNQCSSHGTAVIQGTALMFAAHYRKSGAVWQLLNAGADHTAVGVGGEWEGKTALRISQDTAFCRDPATVKLLQQWTNATEAQRDAQKAAYRVVANGTALRDAAKGGDAAEVRRLVAAGVSPEGAGADYGETPLWWAMMNGHDDVVSALAEGGAEVDKKSVDGYTPLMDAARRGRCGAVRRLLEANADHKIEDDGGRTALGLVQEARARRPRPSPFGMPTREELEQAEEMLVAWASERQ